MRSFPPAARRIGASAACAAALSLPMPTVLAQAPVVPAVPHAGAPSATAPVAGGPAVPDEQPYGWPWLVRALDRLKPDTDTRIPETPTQVAQRLEAMIDSGRSAAALQEIEALQAKRAASTISGVDARLLFLQARALASQGNLPAAVEIYRRMTIDFPELPEPWNNLAALYAAQGRLDDARGALETALLVDPGYAAAKANLGDVYLMLAARAHRDAARQGVPGSGSAEQNVNQLLK